MTEAGSSLTELAPSFPEDYRATEKNVTPHRE